MHPLQQALKDLEQAYAHRQGAPPRKKGRSFRYPDPRHDQARSDQLRLFLPKLGFALPKQPPGFGSLWSKLREVVCIDPNRARRRASPADKAGAVGIAGDYPLWLIPFYAPLNSFKRLRLPCPWAIHQLYVFSGGPCPRPGPLGGLPVSGVLHCWPWPLADAR